MTTLRIQIPNAESAKLFPVNVAAGKLAMSDSHANDNHGRTHKGKRAKVYAHLAKALVHDTLVLSERSRQRRKCAFVKPDPRKMSAKAYRKALDSYNIQTSFSAQHPILALMIIIGSIWVVCKLFGM